MSNRELIQRFWELQEPDLEAYSKRIDELLQLLPEAQLQELVDRMEDSAEWGATSDGEE